MKCPGTAGLAYEMSDFVGIQIPEAPHPAAVAMGKGRSELIASLATSSRKMIARKLQADFT